MPEQKSASDTTQKKLPPKIMYLQMPVAKGDIEKRRFVRVHAQRAHRRLLGPTDSTSTSTATPKSTPISAATLHRPLGDHGLGAQVEPAQPTVGGAQHDLVRTRERRGLHGRQRAAARAELVLNGVRLEIANLRVRVRESEGGDG
jgi:hypothetical protein